MVILKSSTLTFKLQVAAPAGASGPTELKGKKYDYVFDIEVAEGKSQKLGMNKVLAHPISAAVHRNYLWYKIKP